ncbi:MAG: lipoprotein signal peptidase [Muribaculaceae bacterium]|nr:lipoprotein signal peptidase [Muribaculaceae bacterium]
MAAAIIILLVILDQAIKIKVKTGFYLGESLPVTSWFQLVFIENNGMAFGWEIGSKLLLTLGRIAVVAFLIYYICRIRRAPQARTGYLVCLSLIVAGAAGNIIDCVFYGQVFNNPLPPETAVMFPESGGYAPLFFGKVVDMFYFPLASWYWPDWMPWVGGEHFIFFRPIFNLADAAISVGIVMLLLFYSRQISEVPFSLGKAAAPRGKEDDR